MSFVGNLMESYSHSLCSLVEAGRAAGGVAGDRRGRGDIARLGSHAAPSALPLHSCSHLRWLSGRLHAGGQRRRRTGLAETVVCTQQTKGERVPEYFTLHSWWLCKWSEYPSILSTEAGLVYATQRLYRNHGKVEAFKCETLDNITKPKWEVELTPSSNKLTWAQDNCSCSQF